MKVANITPLSMKFKIARMSIKVGTPNGETISLSQTQAAEMAGYNQTGVSALERGHYTYEWTLKRSDGSYVNTLMTARVIRYGRETYLRSDFREIG